MITLFKYYNTNLIVKFPIIKKLFSYLKNNMKLIDSYKMHRNDILNNFQKKTKSLSFEWNSFLNRKTYLTSDIKDKFLQDHQQFFPWFF
jgi:uncharacterized protein YxeA